MLIELFSKHIFWSYKNNVNLPDNIVIKQVAIYGEINDLITLSKLYSKEIITDVLKTLAVKYNKRVNFIMKVIL